jgi:hypothetical protein
LPAVSFGCGDLSNFPLCELSFTIERVAAVQVAALSVFYSQYRFLQALIGRHSSFNGTLE